MIKENSLFGWLAKKLTKLLYKHADVVLTVTHGLCLEIEKYHEKKPHLVMNGYDHEVFYPGKPENKFPRYTLIFHGTLGKLQNIETLLNLASELEKDDLDILVAGEGPKVSYILSANRKNIRYLGNMPYSEIPLLLRKCHLGLSFRTDDKIGKEAFPVKVFEYVGSGIPVIMSPPGEAGKIIMSQELGKEFQNSQIKEMAEEVRRLKHIGETSNRINLEFSRAKQAMKIHSLIGQTRTL